MTSPFSLAVKLRMLMSSAEEVSGLSKLDARSRDILYFVAQRELAGVETAVSHVILNDRFGSLGTVQRHLYALIADHWLETRESTEDARRKNILLGPLSRDALRTMSDVLARHFRTEAEPAPPGDSRTKP